MGIVTGLLTQLLTNGVKLSNNSSVVGSSNPLPVTTALPLTYAENFNAVLTGTYQKVVTTTTTTKALRMSANCSASAYDIEYQVVAAGAAAPTTSGIALLAGDDFLAGIPVGDIYVRSLSLQKLIVWSA